MRISISLIVIILHKGKKGKGTQFCPTPTGDVEDYCGLSHLWPSHLGIGSDCCMYTALLYRKCTLVIQIYTIVQILYNCENFNYMVKLVHN